MVVEAIYGVGLILLIAVALAVFVIALDNAWMASLERRERERLAYRRDYRAQTIDTRDAP